jgi:hypothetical protein
MTCIVVDFALGTSSSLFVSANGNQPIVSRAAILARLPFSDSTVSNSWVESFVSKRFEMTLAREG